ncbi:hypothetical protein P170DRAFT_470166 [Aspergillus steynii IBT 23096]|uniref:Fungal-specific transcription factor domain-containing protein n=1 Tax=Aspergillus steynii IBT 23096 TaxID=1392250 RepID=A0A2I2GPB6_9EURO|nr:uncharacterized protein P170DRAFT_470166 [Aspergillus steynii IBT 23096]PLB54720.1 hypothetical protein P170DRAFT_470166 [Aspergillus steynii IBT 23096]
MTPRPSLPSLINGVHTPTERRLYNHFSQVLSQLLVLQTSNQCNPIAAAILPLSTADKGLLSLVMTVSAAHLLKLLFLGGHSIENPEYVEVQRLKWKFFGQGTRIHGQRIQELYADKPVSNKQYTIALASTMLLCQYNTGEGGFDGGWKMHLGAAHELVKCLKRRSGASNVTFSSAAVLEDWFLYHQLISKVTDQNPLCHADHFEASSNPSSDLLLIGSQDGLLSIVGRIMDLKTQILLDDDPSVPSYLGLTFGLEISVDLEAWDYQYPTQQQRVVGECYRWAAFILLYATVYQCQLLDDKIQTALEGGLTYLDDLCDTDHAQICALFPMFIFGVSAVSRRDRDRVREKMDAYYKWSGLGNIIEAKTFLELWWEQCDQAEDRNWWQWHALASETALQPILT